MSTHVDFISGGHWCIYEAWKANEIIMQRPSVPAEQQPEFILHGDERVTDGS